MKLIYSQSLVRLVRFLRCIQLILFIFVTESGSGAEASGSGTATTSSPVNKRRGFSGYVNYYIL